MSKETTLNVVFCLRQIPQGKHSNINFRARIGEITSPKGNKRGTAARGWLRATCLSGGMSEPLMFRSCPRRRRRAGDE